MDRLIDLLVVFLRVNLLSTSGPASVGLLYGEAVPRFISEAQFVQAVGLSSVLPGSDALQLAMYVGYASGGVAGGLAALLGSILPPTVIILCLTLVLHRLRRQAWVSSFVEGLTPAIAVLLVFTSWKIFQRGGETGSIGWALAAASLVAMVLKAPARLVMLGAGLLGIYFFQ
jgi:chromate transporter